MMGSLCSKREERVKLKQYQVTASSPEHALALQNQPEAAGDETRADDILPGLKDVQLLYFIDFDNGLLDELIGLGVINREEFEPFRINGLNNGACRKAQSQLLNHVINAKTALKESFLSALDRTQQSHVANYIRHNGQLPANTDDNWPAFEGNRVIDQHFSRLVDLIDIECGLLDELISAGILNDGQKAAVSANDLLDRKKVTKLLHIMRRKSVADYKKFVHCLEKTKQIRALSLLDPSATATNPPLSEYHCARLDANQSDLVELIDTRNCGLIEALRAVECLTYKQSVYIESTDNALVRTRRLLDIVRRGSESDYLELISCLNRTGQQHVANVLLTDTAVSQITARGSAVDEYESYIIESFKNLLQNRSPVDRQQLLQSITLGPGSELIFMKTTQSITLFITSQSLSALMHLHDMYRNGQLKSKIQRIFSIIVGRKLNVIIDKLTWDRSNYNRCVRYLSETSGLLIYPKIYQHLSDTTDTEPPVVSSSIINRLPHELIEILLIKAAGQLFVDMKIITTNAATYTLVALSAVSRYWWQTLTYRRSNTRRLRRYCMSLCRPLTFNPRPDTSLQIEGKQVNGVFAFGGKLYVAIDGSTAIYVYDLSCNSSCDVIERIKVPGLRGPFDLVACSSTCCLFVSDLSARCIWRVNLSNDSLVVDQTNGSLFVANLQYAPCGLSIQSERLLVTAYSGDALHVYDINDVEERSQCINLPDDMMARHAVETSRGTYVVAHESIRYDDTRSVHTGVSELSACGHFLRVYKGPTPFSRPFYITTVNGHYLVSDRNNHQILQLNIDLELTQVLIADLYGNPVRQSHSIETGRFYLALANSDTLTVYHV